MITQDGGQHLARQDDGRHLENDAAGLAPVDRDKGYVLSCFAHAKTSRGVDAQRRLSARSALRE